MAAIRHIRLVDVETWGVSSENEEYRSEIYGRGANGGEYIIHIPATRQNVRELAYALRHAIDHERMEMKAMLEYVYNQIDVTPEEAGL